MLITKAYTKGEKSVARGPHLVCGWKEAYQFFDQNGSFSF